MTSSSLHVTKLSCVKITTYCDMILLQGHAPVAVDVTTSDGMSEVLSQLQTFERCQSVERIRQN